MHVIGLDIGFGNVKRAVGHSGSHAPRYDSWPAVAMPARDDGFSALSTANGAARHVKVDDEAWYVGVDPEQEGAREVLHEGYVGSQVWRAHFLAGLMQDPRMPASRLVLGLPVDEWSDPKARAALTEVAQSTALAAGVVIHAIDVVPQPLGSFVDANVRHHGDLIHQRVLVVDPGRYTLDWTLFVNGKLNKSGSDSDRRGAVSRIIEGITEEVHARYDTRVGQSRVRKALEAGTQILIRGHRIDCAESIRKVSARVVDDALERIRDTLRVEHDVDRIVLSGGGADFYKSRLCEVFGEDLVDTAPRPVQANVRGYWWYGTRAS